MNALPGFQRARKPEEREARRAALLVAAGELFDAEGPLGAGLNAIAARAGFTKSNVYRYFESREEVLLDLFVAAMEDLVPALVKALGAATPGDVAGIAGLLARAFETRPRLCQLLAIVTGVLESNVSEETIMRTKRRMAAFGTEMAKALQAKLPGASLADCNWVLAMLATLAGGLAPATRPAPAAARVLARAEFAAMRPNLARDLARTAEALLASIT